MRNRAWRRYKNYTKARRKRDIDLNSHWWPANYAALFNYEVREQRIGWYDNLHQYSKNKIHCSCPMCSAKTNTRKSKGNGPVSSRYANHHFGTSNERYGKKNYKVSDKKKIQKLNYDYKENMI